MISYAKLRKIEVYYATLRKLKMDGNRMARVKNPFITDSIVDGEDYCSRKVLEERILTKLESGHKLALIGDRRVGKSSTAHYVIDNMKGIYKVDIDLYHVADAVDIAEAMIDACKKILDEVWDSKKILDMAKNVKPKLELASDGFSLGFDTRAKEFRKTLNIAFEFLDETIKRTKKKIVILFDEFQAIKDVKDGHAILKYMRGKIQKLNRIPIMYVGSIRHEMDNIFRDQGSPFFKQTEIIYFEHIEEGVFYQFVSKKFKKKKIIFKEEVYKHLYEICYGITGDIQQFCRVAFDNLKEDTEIDFDTFFRVIEIIYKNELKYFQATIEGKELTKVQQKFLLQIANAQNQEGTKLFGQEIQKACGVTSPGALRNAMIALEKKSHIYKSEGRYCFSSPFFKEYLLDYKLFIKATAGTLVAGGNLTGTRLSFGYRELIKKEHVT